MLGKPCYIREFLLPYLTYRKKFTCLPYITLAEGCEFLNGVSTLYLSRVDFTATYSGALYGLCTPRIYILDQ